MNNKTNTNTNIKMTQEEIPQEESTLLDLKKKEIEEVNLKRKDLFKKMSEIEDDIPCSLCEEMIRHIKSLSRFNNKKVNRELSKLFEIVNNVHDLSKKLHEIKVDPQIS
jgi:hypothetical protein